MTYEAALGYLADLIRLGPLLGTERLSEVLRRLGSPHERIPAVHLAGTNGKGSTSAMVASILCRAAAREAEERGRPPRRIGLYTSPHLLRLSERIRVSDARGELAECTPDELCRAFAAVQRACMSAPAVELSFFEAITAAAFLHFAAAEVEVAVIETGLGGRLDATRVCAAAVTVITSISGDHLEYLGPTLADVAREKAGIFKPGIPALCACEDPSARAMLIREAQRIGAPIAMLPPVAAQPGTESVPALPALPADYAAVIPLPGAHQVRNAALAVHAVRALRGPLSTYLEPPAIVKAGLAATKWPGRLERLPVPTALAEAAPTVYVDAAHNPEGAEALAAWLTATLPATPARLPTLTVVMGVVNDKELSGMLAPLARAGRLILTQPPSPRGRSPQSVLDALPARLRAELPIAVEPDPQQALHRALRDTPNPDNTGIVLFYGSIFLIGAVRGHLLGEPADPPTLQDPMRGFHGGAVRASA